MRSSSLHHVRTLLEGLRMTRHPDASTRWILLLQPEVLNHFEIPKGTDMTILIYDRGGFSYESLKKFFREKFPIEKIDRAYVPANNREAQGYLEIVRFVSSLGIPCVLHIRPDIYLETAPMRYALDQTICTIKTGFAGAAEIVTLIFSVPLIVLAYTLLILSKRLRYKSQPETDCSLRTPCPQ